MKDKQLTMTRICPLTDFSWNGYENVILSFQMCMDFYCNPLPASKNPSYLSVDFPTLNHIVPSATPATQAQAAKDLIERLVLQHAANFMVAVDPSIGPKFKDTFRVCW